MKFYTMLLALLLSLGLVSIGCDGVIDDDDSADDDTADDDTSGDDDVTPEYTGEIDMANALLYGECTATVESDPANPDQIPEGWFEFEIEMEGWAFECWIEFWDLVSSYCEGYDPNTGDPCEPYGYSRPGWEMSNVDYGWDATDGFWDYYDAYIEYIMDLAQADAAGKSIFICENAGNNFETWFCCTDDYTELAYCTEFIW